MKIAINLLPYAPGMQGGSEVYIRSIIKELGTIDKQNHYILFISEDIKGEYLPKNNAAFLEVVVLKKDASRIKRIAYEQFVLPYYCFKYKVDLLISNYVVPILSPSKTIGIIHDMQYKRMPDLFEKSKLYYWNLFIPLTIWKSELIGTVSHFSLSEIAHFYPKSKDKLFVTAEGVKQDIRDVCDKHIKDDIDKSNFILSVATFGEHKNLKRLIEAMPKTVQEQPSITLKLVGEARTPDAIAVKNELLKILEENNISDNVDFLGFVSDQELADLYRKCKLYVFPSLYEGFGLPLIEAQYCGAPVVCAEAGSLPEIGAESVVRFDPYSVDSIAHTISQTLNDEEVCKALVLDGYENIKKYTWKKAAEDLLENIYKLRRK